MNDLDYQSQIDEYEKQLDGLLRDINHVDEQITKRLNEKEQWLNEKEQWLNEKEQRLNEQEQWLKEKEQGLKKQKQPIIPNVGNQIGWGFDKDYISKHVDEYGSMTIGKIGETDCREVIKSYFDNLGGMPPRF